MTVQIEKLGARHLVKSFDCGEPALNSFLVKHALQAQQSDGSTTYVAVDPDAATQVLGYSTLAVGSAAFNAAPPRIAKGQPNRPVPVMVLGRLATDRRWQGQGLGNTLLKDAMQRTLAAAEIAGIRAIVVHAKHEEARNFYLHYDFVPSPIDDLYLFMLMRDVRRLLVP